MLASEAPCSSISKNQMKSLKPGHHSAKILLFRTHHLKISTTELTLVGMQTHLRENMWFTSFGRDCLPQLACIFVTVDVLLAFKPHYSSQAFQSLYYVLLYACKGYICANIHLMVCTVELYRVFFSVFESNSFLTGLFQRLKCNIMYQSCSSNLLFWFWLNRFFSKLTLEIKF